MRACRLHDAPVLDTPMKRPSRILVTKIPPDIATGGCSHRELLQSYARAMKKFSLVKWRPTKRETRQSATNLRLYLLKNVQLPRAPQAAPEENCQSGSKLPKTRLASQIFFVRSFFSPAAISSSYASENA